MSHGNEEHLFSIRGKRVLITGGTAGIGLGVARHFVEQGARVVICGRRAGGMEIASDIGAQFVQMDVQDPQAVADATRFSAEMLGASIDVLILNAGVDLVVGTIDDFDLDAFRRLYETNLFGIVLCLKEACCYLVKGSSVIVTSSPAACIPAPGVSAYGSSKAALNHLTRVFAAELAAKGIRVNAVLPGIVKSEMSGSTGSLESIRTLTLTGMVREPSEMGGTFQFLASAASGPVTGAILAADDGMSAGLSEAVVHSINRSTEDCQ